MQRYPINTPLAILRLVDHAIKERWFLKKSLAIWASLWLVMNWILGVIFVPKTPYFFLLDKIFYFGVELLLLRSHISVG